MKELRFHPQYQEIIATTAADSFNIFRPNLDPEDEANQFPEESMEESKEESASTASNPSKRGRRRQEESSDSEGSEEERRMEKIAR